MLARTECQHHDCGGGHRALPTLSFAPKDLSLYPAPLSQEEGKGEGAMHTAQTPLPVLCCPFANAKMKGKGEGADCSQPGPSSLPSTPLPGPPAHIIEVDLIGGSPWGGCGEKAGSEQGRAVLGWGHGGQGTEMPRAEEAAGSGGELTPMGAVTAQVHVSHGDTVTCGTGGCSSTSNTEKGLGCPWSLPCATPVPATHRGSSG